MNKDIFGNPLEFGKMWNLHCQVGNDVVKLKETQKTLSDVVDECIRQCDQANQCLIKGREIVKVTAIENEKLKAKIERLERAGDAMDALIMSEIYARKLCFVPGDVKEWRTAKDGKDVQ